jgi:hypothetical protein
MKRKASIVILIAILSLTVFLLVGGVTQAADTEIHVDEKVKKPISGVIKRIKDFFSLIVVSAAVIMIMYFAIVMIIADNPEKAQSAKTNLKRVLMGVAIYGLAYLLVNLISWIVSGKAIGV